MENVLEMIHVWVVDVVAVVVEILTRRLKMKPRTAFSSRASGAGYRYRDFIEDIGVAYALVGVSSSVIALICVAHRIRHNQKKRK